jgi:hypothetical protein
MPLFNGAEFRFFASNLHAIRRNTRPRDAALRCHLRPQRRISSVPYRIAELGNTATRAVFQLLVRLTSSEIDFAVGHW